MHKKSRSRKKRNGIFLFCRVDKDFDIGSDAGSEIFECFPGFFKAYCSGYEFHNVNFFYLKAFYAIDSYAFHKKFLLIDFYLTPVYHIL